MDLSDDEIEQKTQWMIHNSEETTCRKYMLDTAWARYSWIREKNDDGSKRSVSDILEQYPRLLDPGNVSNRGRGYC